MVLKNNKKQQEDYWPGFSMPEKNKITFKRGLSKQVVGDISLLKEEPSWMRELRLKAYESFINQKLPDWGPDLTSLDFQDLVYFIRATDPSQSTWEDVPGEIKNTYEKLGVPIHERNFLAGVSAQYESEVVYKRMQEELDKQGVIFCDMDTALRKHSKIVKEYFGKIVSYTDNKFAALNTAVWSGGSFIYIPKNIQVSLPLQAYFRMNAARFGQFERTLIIADEGSSVHYIEGCTAPIYTTSSLHAAVVEVFVKKKAKVRYSTIQNWSTNVFNLVTKRADVKEHGIMEWVDCNLGSGVTMKYPSVLLSGEYAKGEMLSIAFASKNQQQDAGTKMIHLAPYTSSRILSKSISKSGGETRYRGLVSIAQKAKYSKSFSTCDALILDKNSKSATFPTMRMRNKLSIMQHEATVEKIDEEKLCYLQMRGIAKSDAQSMLVNGFISDIVKELPFEYAVEMNRLVKLEMDSSVG